MNENQSWSRPDVWCPVPRTVRRRKSINSLKVQRNQICDFSERELIELVVAVAMETFYNRLNSALGIESQGFCELPALAGAARQRQAV